MSAEQTRVRGPSANSLQVRTQLSNFRISVRVGSGWGGASACGCAAGAGDAGNWAEGAGASGAGGAVGAGGGAEARGGDAALPAGGFCAVTTVLAATSSNTESPVAATWDRHARPFIVIPIIANFAQPTSRALKPYGQRLEWSNLYLRAWG